jgi:hypothetical protein
MKIITVILFIIFTIPAIAQEHTHQHGADTSKPVLKRNMADTVKKSMKTDSMPQQKMLPPAHQHDEQDMHQDHMHNDMDMHEGHMHGDDHGSMMMMMSHAFSRNLPMTRNGSGTAWLPDNAPMYGYMFHGGKWMYMLHGDVFLRYNKQDLLDKGSRGNAKFDAPNMIMLMGQRNIGEKGLFHFNTMISFDPFTVGGNGYPLLFQTGESYKGVPLVDRQHPHDLFSELSVSYAYALSKTADLFLYLGYPGEPALGPVAYVHRPSGFFNPDAPLTHHWVDATHITFGVATAGFRLGKVKLEASSFNGREPDEHRYGLDKIRFNSWSGRLSYNPSGQWALQTSHGFIKEPEVLHPGEDVNRTTASVTYSSRGFGKTFTNITALWGMNKTKSHNAENGVLLEGSHTMKKTTLYGRYEWVQKSLEELNLDEADFGHDALFPVHAFTSGVQQEIFGIGKTRVALGGQFSFYDPGTRLSGLYGDNPLAGEVFLRIYPGVMGSKMGKLFLPY